MLYEHLDYRTYLKSVLVERISRNSSYSLRAFAAQIGIAPGMLSEVFRGRKNISAQKGIQIAAKLGLESDQEIYFLNLVQFCNTDKVEDKEKILTKLNRLNPSQPVRDLSVDHFHSISNWICSAGITLIDANPKGLRAKEIGARLGVTSYEAEEAMARWIALDLLEKKASGVYVKLNSDHLMMKSASSHSALKAFYRKMFEKASAALDQQSNQEKLMGFEVLAFDPDQLEEVRIIVEESISKILKKAKNGKCTTEVYQLGFQFFRLTLPKNPRKAL
jgi:uncharacterized protein (TIGR02147 family)